MVGRLGKYFARAQSEQKYSPEEQVKDADFLAKKAVAKVTKMASDVKVEAEEYKRELEAKEEKALAKASQALEALVGKATVSDCSPLTARESHSSDCRSGGTRLWLDLARRCDRPRLAA